MAMPASLFDNMDTAYRILHFPVDAAVTDVAVPASKSIGARALILDYIYGCGVREDIADCLDNRQLQQALRELSLLVPDPMARLAEQAPAHVVGEFHLGAGGTSMRFFLALVASIPGLTSVIDCDAQLKARPVAPLVDALRAFGADIRYMEQEGCLPLAVEGQRLAGGTSWRSPGGSSQYASAVLMASALWANPVDIDMSGSDSLPYYIMTEKMCARYRQWHLAASETDSSAYSAGDPPASPIYKASPIYPASPIYNVEGDWSAAGFFYLAALLNPGKRIRVHGLSDPAESLQGDAPATVEIFSGLGVTTTEVRPGVLELYQDFDTYNALDRKVMRTFSMENTPDLVPALVVGLVMSCIPFTVTGVSSLRIKESDRIHALVSQLRKLDYELDCDDDTISWPEVVLVNRYVAGRGPAVLDTYRDHRMVMAFAQIAFNLGSVYLTEIASVAKSFPDYFPQMATLGLKAVPESSE